MGHRGSPCGHALSPAHAMPRPLSSVSRPGYLTPAYLTPNTWDLTPDTWDLMPAIRDRRPVTTGTPVDPVVRMSHFPIPDPPVFDTMGWQYKINTLLRNGHSRAAIRAIWRNRLNRVSTENRALFRTIGMDCLRYIEGIYIRGVGLAVVTLLLNTACVPSSPARRILLITFDAARWDMFPRACGNHRGRPVSMPHVERFCRESHVFTRAFAPAPNTTLSIASLYTGQTPFHHRIHPRQPLLAPAYVTLAELFQRHRYVTYVLSANTGPFSPFTLLTQGFAHVRHPELGKYAHARHTPKWYPNVLVDVAIRDLPAVCRYRCFVHLHFVQPHTPYGGPGWAFQPPRESWSFLSYSEIRRRFQIIHTEPRRVPPRVRRVLRAHYRAGLRWVDREFGRLMRFIDAQPWGRTTWIILTADHAEAFGEHRFWMHGMVSFDEMLHIPMVIRPPWRHHQRHEELVSLVDLYATLLNIAKIRWPFVPFDSIPLHLHAEKRRLSRAFVMLMADATRSIRTRRWKYTYWIRWRCGALYHLDRDPGEQHNVAVRYPDQAHRLHLSIERYVHERWPPTRVPAFGLQRPDPGEAERMFRALGYVGVHLLSIPLRFDVCPAPLDPEEVQAHWQVTWVQDDASETQRLMVRVTNTGDVVWPHRADIEYFPYPVRVRCFSENDPRAATVLDLPHDVVPNQQVRWEIHWSSAARTVVCELVQSPDRVLDRARVSVHAMK